MSFGGGGEGPEDREGRVVWPVSVFTLTTAMGLEFQKLGTDQNFVPVGHVRDSQICYLNEAPPVDLSIRVAPEDRRVAATIQMTQLGGNFQWLQPTPPPPHPYMITPPAGVHRLSAVYG